MSPSLSGRPFIEVGHTGPRSSRSAVPVGWPFIEAPTGRATSRSGDYVAVPVGTALHRGVEPYAGSLAVLRRDGPSLR
jgi:hypothetical protein